MKRVTMKDVALESGVSTTAVSMALRNHPDLRKDTRERIQKLANEMGYAPNPMVSALMSQVASGRVVNQGVVIGVLVDKQYDPKVNPDPDAYSNRLLQGIFERLSELGCDYELFIFSNQRRMQLRLDHVLRTRAIRGILLPGVWEVGAAPELDWHQLLAVTSSHSLRILNLHRVAADQFAAMRLALSVLRDRGYSRPLFHTDTRMDQRVDGLELAAYRDTIARHFSDSLAQPLFLMEDGWNAATFAESVRRHQPDVVISNYAGAERWLREMNFRIPADIGFLRLGHLGPKDHAHTDLNAARIGRGMVDLLTAGLQRNEIGIPEWPKRFIIAPSFIDGRTIRPAAPIPH